jgi:hypothetical protein
MEEDKPVTSLVLFQPLELIPYESLPTKFGTELAALKQQKKWALSTLRSSLVPACLTSVMAVGFLMVAIYAFFGVGLFLPYVISAAFCVLFSIGSVFTLRDHMQAVDAYRQITIPAQLQIGADNEFCVSEMADVTNNAIVVWNKRVQCALPEDMDERFVAALKKEREFIVSKISQVKIVIEAIKRDRFEPESEEDE